MANSGCWVFNQDQLARALQKIKPDDRTAILDFLTSEMAKEESLIVPLDGNLDSIRGGVLGRVFKLSKGAKL